MFGALICLATIFFLLILFKNGPQAAKDAANSDDLIGGGVFIFLWFVVYLGTILGGFELLKHVLPIEEWKSKKYYIRTSVVAVVLFFCAYKIHLWLVSLIFVDKNKSN